MEEPRLATAGSVDQAPTRAHPPTDPLLHAVAVVNPAVVVAAPTEEPRVMDTYCHMSVNARIKVKPGVYPTLQIEDAEGRVYSVNVSGTSGQLRDIANAITEYLAEKGKAEIAAMPTNEYLDQVG